MARLSAEGLGLGRGLVTRSHNSSGRGGSRGSSAVLADADVYADARRHSATIRRGTCAGRDISVIPANSGADSSIPAAAACRSGEALDASVLAEFPAWPAVNSERERLKLIGEKNAAQARRGEARGSGEACEAEMMKL